MRESGLPRMRLSLPLLPRLFGGWRSDRLHLVVLGLILLVAAAFRVNGLETWDDNSHQHPDERFMTLVSSAVTVPASIGDYFNTARSSLHQYAHGQSNYPYGQLRLQLTLVVAVWTKQPCYHP